jgi:hypothetical protein
MPRRRIGPCYVSIVSDSCSVMFVVSVMAPMSQFRRSLSAPLLCGLVWRHLERFPCQRPLVQDLANALGTTERGLRRACRLAGLGAVRRHLAYGCLTFAASLIAAGIKSDAAIRLAGFRSRWNFNRQCRAFGLGSATACRAGESRIQFDRAAVKRALHAYGDFRTASHERPARLSGQDASSAGLHGHVGRPASRPGAPR